MRETVLVTGGAGYIGSHACKALARAGFAPVTLDNMVYGHDWAVQWGPLVRGDILDRAALDKVMATYEPAAVMHFAAFAYVGESVADPGKYYTNNVAGTLSLLEAMRAAGCRSIIFSSTCATYGVPQRLPLTEDHPQQPINPYGWSKLMIEQMLADYAAAYGFRHATLRYFNAAGADPDGQVGEDHAPETHLIPLVLDAAAGRRGHIEVFGTDYDSEDGTAVRDYIHVTDLADAHVLALEALLAENDSLTLNLGTGHGYTVRQVIQAVERVTGLEVPVREGPRRPGDPPVLVADPARAEEVLGWRCGLSALDEVVRTAWQWHRAHHGA
jgi:UDP-arabinose 4-epimerase